MTEAFPEPQRAVPVAGDADVIVCGGGPAGLAAAVVAARSGARTRLLETNGCLGGVWTAGLLTWLFEFDKPGLTAELTRKLDDRGARRDAAPDRYVYEVEEMKLLLEEMLLEAGVEVQLHTRVVAGHCDRESRLTTIITESKSGRQAWRARAFVDATGDGDLAAQAGCGWDCGHPESGVPQPMTLNALVVVRSAEELKEYVSFWQGDLSWRGKAVDAFAGELRRAGIEPSYGAPTLFHMRDNLLTLMVNHEYGVCSFDAAQVTAATIRSRAEVNGIVKGLRSLGGKWEGIQLAATAEQIGIREGRRIHGRYQVTQADLMNGARHEDAVTRVSFNVDVHALTRKENETKAISTVAVKPYDIPLRALIAKDVDGLLLAGRCISGDFIAHASYRVTGAAVALGEAAGALASASARRNELPHQVPWEATRSLLERHRGPGHPGA